MVLNRIVRFQSNKRGYKTLFDKCKFFFYKSISYKNNYLQCAYCFDILTIRFMADKKMPESQKNLAVVVVIQAQTQKMIHNTNSNVVNECRTRAASFAA